MSSHPLNWLLEPKFPAHARLPRLDHEMLAVLASDDDGTEADPASSECPSGTWHVGERARDSELTTLADSRLRTSDSEALTVRPGALFAAKR